MIIATFATSQDLLYKLENFGIATDRNASVTAVPPLLAKKIVAKKEKKKNSKNEKQSKNQKMKI